MFTNNNRTMQSRPMPPLPQQQYDTHEGNIQQYLSLLSEKISMINMKIDNLKLENTKMFDTIDNRTQLLNDKFDDLCNMLNDSSSISTMGENNENDVENSEEELNSNDEENSHICDDCQIKNSKKKKYIYDNNEDPKKQKGIIVKFKNNSMFNPLDFLMNLGQSMKTKEQPKEVDSEDEYDDTFKIRDETDTIVVEKEYVNMDIQLNNINDIIKLGEKYKDLVDKQDVNTNKDKSTNKCELSRAKRDIPEEYSDSDEIFDIFDIKRKKESAYCKFYVLDGKKYNINFKTVCKLTQPLKKLNRMVGLKNVKEQIFEMIIYYLQGFENENKNMLHSVIEGPPGVGKTKLGKILSQIYCAMDIIPSNKFKYVKATDLIGDHVGATKHMTQSIIDEADGGVLFIDEAYALSTNDTKDPYGKECMDTLNFNLSENKKKLIVIIAGYAEQLEKCFFSHNPGLQRRFPFRYKVDKYSPAELSEIFQDKIKKFRWKISNEITEKYLEDFFQKNLSEFKHFGGDIENFFKKCQFSHAKRTIDLHPAHRGKLSKEDINNGFANFIKNKKKEDSTEYMGMFM
jgi:hypothetical protein